MIKLPVTIAYEDHISYWNKQKNTCTLYRDAFHVEFFKNRKDNYFPEFYLLIETADTYASIESYMSALFPKSPAIELDNPSVSDADKEAIKVIVDNFLYDKSEEIQDACRLGLVYPGGFIKCIPRESEDPFARVDVTPIEPWNIIVDKSAKKWEDQRYCGHIYYLSVQDARSKFGNKEYCPVPYQNYFDDNIPSQTTFYKGLSVDDNLPEDYQFIKVVEFYDFIKDELIFYTENVKDYNDQVLDKMQIPIRDYDDVPICPVIPLFFSKRTDSPMEGLSAIGRIYDQISEKNILRTFLANSNRRDARQYLYRKDAISNESLSQIQEGVDGAMIGVESDTLGDVIRPLEIPATSRNIDNYFNYIESDLQRSSIMAPFSRGEATKATATEVAQLSAYTASEVGKMAKVKDNAIVMLARVYLRMLVNMIEDGETLIAPVKKEFKLLTVDQLDKNFKIYAVDQGGDPISRNMKKAEFVQLIPTLAQLGVAPDKMLEELVNLYDLPLSLLEKPEEPELPEQQGEAETPEGAAADLLGQLGAQEMPPTSEIPQV